METMTLTKIVFTAAGVGAAVKQTAQGTTYRWGVRTGATSPLPICNLINVYVHISYAYKVYVASSSSLLGLVTC